MRTGKTEGANTVVMKEESNGMILGMDLADPLANTKAKREYGNSGF